MALRAEEERGSESHSVMEWMPITSRQGWRHRLRKQADFSLVFPHEKT